MTVSKLLIVEDEVTHAELIGRAFETENHQFELTFVANLAHAKQLLINDAFDLVVVDWLLPDGKGLDLLTNSDARLIEQQPFLVMTSHGNEAVAVEAMKAGALDYVVKSPAMFMEMPRIAGRIMREWGHILAHKQAEAAAHHTALELKTYIEAAAQGVIVFDNQCAITLSNREAERIFGYDSNSLRGTSIELLFPDVFCEVRESRTRQFFPDAEATPNKAIEVNGVRKDGAIFPIELNWSLVENRNRSATIVVFTDITERKHLQLEVFEARRIQAELAKEQEIRKYKERFLSMFSHEFRTPLSIIQTSSNLLHKYYDRLKPGDHEKYFGQIIEQIKRLDQMVEDIILLSRKDQSRLDFHPEKTNLKQFLSKIVNIMSKSVPDVQVICTIDTEHDSAIMDQKLMEHILTNLMGNAIKYSPDETKIYVDVTMQDNEVVFAVSDDGIGIPEEDQKNIFDTFYRADNVGQISGTGLGLVIVSEFVKMHRGKVSLQSKVGEGTTFTVRIPFDDVAT